uniref:DNA-binding transcriptional response regulator, NtrC family, contains REC, AAA-type ATPase, and a Fis-type DNA-binding domains n=1 Tax=Candidatus Kentrum sp. FM TaxID=2126340 RepID=A0A450VMJ3_9GAMM|nr:MAG: DNA-binding transcriptional response regulator, NtrC family, contains REC, AAA-type ATPase, and a Fis-type DNA-binding domains [Candidatus Kentron sp. FM]VFJ43963.1 MAG: DNA-binding transcriptional response regulator, NtrC family, contains REC, AAA-type ATPase, and a Fis-type DNA-binding domains [Candidatus Kentron sp. FM]VFK06019.1 MAG: DNA-binding transcriptional response regulator, NtrC family, contains REC, AAA-type ATPase, and a Fis-type DNA-binding domains [Candidatus Kentron sp. FM
MSKQRLLIVDDDRAFTAKLTGALEGLFDVESCHSELEFQERYAMGRFDLVIMDMRLREGKEGLDLLKGIHAEDPLQPVIVMTAYADLASHIDAMESGALNYLDKREFSPGLIARTVEALAHQGTLQRRVAELEQQLAPPESTEIIGASDAIREVRSHLHRAAGDGRAPVLVTGEPGSGRTLAARYIHHLSHTRSDGPFVSASFTVSHSRPRSAEAEILLFGGSRDPGNGRSDAGGWLDSAKGGILFLNDAHVLNAGILEGLSRYLETGSFWRVGGESYVESDVQLIFSTTPEQSGDAILDDLREVVERYGGITIRIPPLRERREDINPLAHHILNSLYRQGETRVRTLRETAITLLEEFDWPGNVRELESAVEYAAIRADAVGETEIAPYHLPQTVVDRSARAGLTISALDYQRHLARAELALVASAMETFSTTKQADLAARLHYNDRYTFARRIRRCFERYPDLEREFPDVRRIFMVR